MRIVIEEVKNRWQLKQFVDLPYRLYRNDPVFVPPLRMDEVATLRRDKNPAFEYSEARYWLAYRNQKPVGRVAAIINKAYNEKWNENLLRFGWLDFEEDAEIFHGLMTQVEDWARELGVKAVHGPLGFTDFDKEGLLVEGFDQLPTIAGLYNFSYYPDYLSRAGYVKDADWIEYKVKLPSEPDGKLERLAQSVQQRYQLNVVRLKKTKDVLPWAPAIFRLTNLAYSNLYGTVPITPKQEEYYTKQYFSFMRPDFLSLVTDKNNELVAFGVTMPSLSRALQKGGGRLFPLGFYHLLKALKKNDTADLLIVAVHPDMQNKGVNAILMNETLRSYLKYGIKWVETNYQLEDNIKVLGMWDRFEKVQHKRRRCFIKHLNGEAAHV